MSKLEALTQRVRQEQWSPANRHTALHLAATKKAELLQDLAELDAIVLGHHQALAAEEALARVVAAVESIGYTPKQAKTFTCYGCAAPVEKQGLCAQCQQMTSEGRGQEDPDHAAAQKTLAPHCAGCQKPQRFWGLCLRCAKAANAARMDDAEGQGRR